MAFTIPVPDHVIIESIKLSFASKLGNRNDGSDGSETEQLVGIIGQNTILHTLDRELMQESTQHDGGSDLSIYGILFDIKTMGRTCTPKLDYINNLIASQTSLECDAYIFTSLNKRNLRLTICGWMPKEQAMLSGNLYKKGEVRTRENGTQFAMKANTYEIENSQINYTAKSIQDLLMQIKDYALAQKYTSSVTNRQAYNLFTE